MLRWMAAGWVAVLVLACSRAPVRADVFDRYTNPVLARALASEGAKEQKEIALDELIDHDRVLPGVPGAFLIVKTSEGRSCKLLVQPARQKVDADRSVPMLLIERYVTYREGEEQAIVARGQNVSLFEGFRLSLELGQVVPPALGGDLEVVAAGQRTLVRPLGKARLYLITKGLGDLAAPKGARPVVGEVFDPRLFDGTYRLHDDGRRSGKLVLKLEEEGLIRGSYYSDKDGRKYPVTGKVGMPLHAVELTVQFPRTRQTFQGWMFTGDARVIAGHSRMAGREAGFYAERVDD